MKFTTSDERVVGYDAGNGVLWGDEFLVNYVDDYVKSGVPAGCDYWGEITPSLATDWEAYLTICGALTVLFGQEPVVDEIPENPDGYEPEGPR